MKNMLNVIYKRTKDWYWLEVPQKSIVRNNYFHLKYPIGGLEVVEIQKTNVILLDKDVNVILDECDKDTKYEIRRAESKDSYSWKMHQEPSSHTLDEFLKVFKEFYKQKKLDINSIEIFYTTELEERRKQKILFISEMWSEEGIHIYHVYTCESEGRIRLTCSASVFREFDSKLKAKNGRLNRLLHWKDIGFFKNIGYLVYDLGGIDLTEKSTVAKFKLGFSDNIENRYHVLGYQKQGEQKKIFLEYINTAQKKIAYNIVNQLCDKYSFYDKYNKPKSFHSENFWTLDINELPESVYGVDTMCYYYTSNREGDLVYGYDEASQGIEEILHNNIRPYVKLNSNLDNKQLNSIDVCIFTLENRLKIVEILESMAAGCFPIIIRVNREINLEFLSNGENGIIIENGTNDCLDEILRWCDLNGSLIRTRQSCIADKIFATRRWQVLRDELEKLIANEKILKRISR